MELGQLKKELSSRLAASAESRTTDELASFLRMETRSPVEQLKRSLKLELLLTLLFCTCCSIAAIVSNEFPYQLCFSVFLGVGITFAVLLYFLLRKTNSLGGTALPVRTNLVSLISIFKTFQKRYLQFSVGLLPACFAFGYWVSYNNPGAIEKPFRWDVFLYLSALLVFFAIGIYYFTRWYLFRLYGKYIRQLEKSLSELDEPYE